MTITGWRIARLRIPLRTPFRTALRTVDAIDDRVLCLLTEAGAVGWGSAAATARITGETHASLVAAWREHLLPPLLGRSLVEGLDVLVDAVRTAMVGNTSAKAAVDIALHDLAAQAAGQPLATFLGGAPRRFDNDLTISVDTPDQMIEQATLACERGFRALKLKVGQAPADDLERLRRLHAAFASRASLRIDANQGWTPGVAVEVMRALEAEGRRFELVEQPVPAADIDGLALVRSRIATPVLADESVFSADDARRVLAAGAADLVNIKLMKTGGLREALRVAAVARAHGAGLMVGCMLESPIGVAAAAHFAAAAGIERVDLDPPALARHDPVDGNVRFDGAMIQILDTPGLGIRDVPGLEPLDQSP